MPLGRKTTAQRLLDTLDQSLQVAQDVRPALEHLGAAASGRSTGQRMRESLVRSVTPSKLPRLGSSKARKAGLIAAGSVAGLTAGSAGISSLRRRSERSREDS
jgi:hypothetical protein